MCKFFCDACDMTFKDEQRRKTHFAQHQTCGINGCKVEGLSFANGIHSQMQHKSLYAKQIMLLDDSPEELQKWRHERKKNFPKLVGHNRRMAMQYLKDTTKSSSSESDTRIANDDNSQVEESAKLSQELSREKEKKSDRDKLSIERSGSHQRSRSPRRRSRSPHIRSRSPRRRSRSPRRRSPHLGKRSPQLRSRSPQLRSRSPQLRSRSPQLRSRSPHLRSRSPHLRSRSPHLRSRSPHWQSPKRSSRSPKSRDREEAKSTTLPLKEGTPSLLATNSNPKPDRSVHAFPSEQGVHVDGVDRSKNPDISDVIANQAEEHTQSLPTPGIMQSVAALRALKQASSSGNSQFAALRKQLFTDFVKEEFGDSFAEKLKRALDNSKPQDDVSSPVEESPLQLQLQESNHPDKINLLNKLCNLQNANEGQQLTAGHKTLSHVNPGLLEQLRFAPRTNIIPEPEPEPPKQDDVLSRLLNIIGNKQKAPREQNISSNRERLSQNDAAKYYEGFSSHRDKPPEMNSFLTQDDLLNKLLSLGGGREKVQGAPAAASSRETLSRSDVARLHQHERVASPCDSVPLSQDSLVNKLLNVLNCKQKMHPMQQAAYDCDTLSRGEPSLPPNYQKGVVAARDNFLDVRNPLKQGNTLDGLLNPGHSSRNLTMAGPISSERDMLSDALSKKWEGTSSTRTDDFPTADTSSNASRLLSTLNNDQKAQVAQQLSAVASATGRTEVSEDLLSYLILQVSKPKEKTPGSLEGRHTKVENPAAAYQEVPSQQMHTSTVDYQRCLSRQQPSPTQYVEDINYSRREMHATHAGSAGSKATIPKPGSVQKSDDYYEDWLNTQLAEARENISALPPSSSRNVVLSSGDSAEYQDGSEYTVNQNSTQDPDYQDYANYLAALQRSVHQGRSRHSGYESISESENSSTSYSRR